MFSTAACAHPLNTRNIMHKNIFIDDSLKRVDLKGLAHDFSPEP